MANNMRQSLHIYRTLRNITNLIILLNHLLDLIKYTNNIIIVSPYHSYASVSAYMQTWMLTISSKVQSTLQKYVVNNT